MTSSDSDSDKAEEPKKPAPSAPDIANLQDDRDSPETSVSTGFEQRTPRKKISDMSAEQKKEYNRQMQQKRRSAAGGVDKSAEKQTPRKKLKDMTDDEKREYNTQMRKKNRTKNADGNETPNKMNALTPDQKREYTSYRQRKSREKKKALQLESTFTGLTEQEKPFYAISQEKRQGTECETPKKRSVIKRLFLPDPQPSPSQSQLSTSSLFALTTKTTQSKKKKQDSHSEETVEFQATPFAKEMSASELDESKNKLSASRNLSACNAEKTDIFADQHKKTLIRFTYLNLFDVETKAIAVPVFDDSQKKKNFTVPKGSLHEQLLSVCNSQHKNFAQTLPKDFSNYQCHSLWDPLKSRLVTCAILTRSPTATDGKFNLQNEIDLRATYFSILHTCELAGWKSVSFPLLGSGHGNIWWKKSLLIGIQSVLAYLSSVKKTQIQLVYFCVRNERRYAKMGNLLMHHRQFDLNRHTPAEYFKVVDVCMNSIKNKCSYVKFPGTHLRLRTFQSKIDEYQLKKCRETQKTMDKITGISRKLIKRIENATQDFTKLTTEPIVFEEKVFYYVSDEIQIDERVPIAIQCYKFQRLRKLWILSRYYCFYTGAEEEELTKPSKERKKWFDLLKRVHHTLVTMYHHIQLSNNRRCSCVGNHEKLYAFQTRMSHYDPLLEEWLLREKKYSFQVVSNTEIELVYDRSGDPKIFVEEGSSKKYVTDSVESIFESFSTFINNENDNVKAIMQKLDLVAAPRTLREIDYESEEDDSDFEKEIDGIKQLQATVDEIQENLIAAKINKFERHFKKDEKREAQLRNRIYMKRNMRPAFDKLVPCTMDDFIMHLIEDEEWDVDQNALAESSYVWESMTEQLVEISKKDFPLSPLFRLGERNFPCFFCGALKFENEPNKKCCMNGAVWIPPIKKLPPIVLLLFETGKFRRIILNVNSVHAMCSINYNRQPQELHGVQSVKVKGQVAFLPSALYARDQEKPAFGNFLLLNASDERVAERRCESMFQSYPELQEIFLKLKKYLDKNNQFYICYKTMGQLIDERDALHEDVYSLRLRIVTGDELEKYDLNYHRGIYAKRPKDDFVSVAISSDYENNTLPRGMTLYLQNPKDHKILPMSVYDEKCDPLGYVLLFPNGETGYTLKKFPRIDKRHAVSYEDRILEEIEKITQNGENPNEYFNDLEELSMSQNSSAASSALSDDEFDFDSDTEEDDGGRFDEEHIFKNIELDDMQNIEREVGERPKIVMIERFGENYPFRKGEENIPLVSDQNAIDSEPLTMDEMELLDDAEKTLMVPQESAAFENDGYNDEFIETLIEKEHMGEGNDPTRTEEKKQVLEDLLENEDEAINWNDFADCENEFEEVENVCDDEYDTSEKTAENRGNGGVRVQNKGKRKFVSAAEYYTFITKKRGKIPCRFLGKSGKLGQLFIIDAFSRVQQMRMYAVTKHRAVFYRSAKKSQIWNFLNRKMKGYFKNELGMLATLPTKVPGSPKYQRELMMSAVTMNNKLGKPDLFITFTGNPCWEEIKNGLERNEIWADNPELVNAVFNNKLMEFFDDVLGAKKKSRKHHGKMIRNPGIFGPIRWFTYSVEFQQRGMPHVHLLISLENHIEDAATVDKFVSAELPPKPDLNDPDRENKERYRDIVIKRMVHTPCEYDMTAYCNEGRKPKATTCKKHFPHPLSDSTILNDNEYPKYKRTNTGYHEIMRNGRAIPIDSRYVVSHNPYLLTKYDCHINVEVVSTIRLLRYMFKYIYKGSDRVLLEIKEKFGVDKNGKLLGDVKQVLSNGILLTPEPLSEPVKQKRIKEITKLMKDEGVDPRMENGKRGIIFNECDIIQDCRCLTANEAMWKLEGRPMHGSSHIIHRAYVHAEGEETIFFKDGEAEKALERIEKSGPKTMITAWFAANRAPILLDRERTTRHLTLGEMFQYYKYVDGQFLLRERDLSHRVIGRIQTCQPRYLELTATRILCMNVPGPRSWDELRTVDGIVYKTCLQAARERRLMNGEKEWDDAIVEAAGIGTPSECRRLFASILLTCAPANPKELFENNWECLVEQKKWTDNKKTAHALKHIQYQLNQHGMFLKDYELDEILSDKQIDGLTANIKSNDPDIAQLTTADHSKEEKEMKKTLNQDQLAVAEFVSEEIGKSREQRTNNLIYVNGAGGTGKTFLYTYLYHKLNAEKRKVLCVAHTGIAANLLPNGCTAHRKFHIPLNIDNDLTCRLELSTKEAEEMRNVDVIFWDEISMTDRRVFDAVSNLFIQLHNSSTVPFGGTMVVMAGDWRQLLPIVDKVQGEAIVHYIIKSSALWKSVKEFKLTVNQRALEDLEYSAFMLNVGDGTNYFSKKRKMIVMDGRLVHRGTERELVDWVFPDMSDMDSVKSSAILTLDNKSALRLNNEVLAQLPGETKIYTSIDVPDEDNGLMADPEVFANETPQGMPPHVLRLKVGAQVILLRNMDVRAGLCNGTRLTVTDMGKDIITCVPNIIKPNTPPRVFFHRMYLTASGKGLQETGFKRLQFPLRLSYAFTVNKSQGQTLSRVGLILNSNVFSHGQIYVALSRVRKSADFKILHFKRNNSDDTATDGGILVRNIVYESVLKR